MADPTPVIDGANAAIYGLRGRWTDAWISAAGAAVPYAGDALKAARLARRATKMIPAADASAIARLNAANRGPGQFVGDVEYMSLRANAYQTQVTGLPSGALYRVNGVDFDGIVNGALIDAKGPGYAWAVENGAFREGYNGAAELLTRAGNQLRAAGEGATIQWHFAEEAAANATRRLFEEQGITGIEIVVTPIARGTGG